MHSSSHLLRTYPEFLATLIRGDGVYVYDDKDNRYLDFLSGIAVVSLGHSNEEILKVASEQLHRLQHVSNYFRNEYTEMVASKINDIVRFENNKIESGKVFFTNSGAEANECAIKIAKRYGQSKRFRFATALNSFHGRTIATLKATGQPLKHEQFEPLPDYFDYFEFGNLDSLNNAINDETVAIMIEVIQGEGGVQQADQEFFDGLSLLSHQHELIIIVDEIQTGMCRTGKWCGFQHYNLEPDIVTFAKALGNGMPIGACWSKDTVANVMQVGDHGSTFGGQPLALSIANKVLDIMERDDMAMRTLEIGELFINHLKESNLFVDIRGKGLIIGADIDKNYIGGSAKEFAKRCFDNGLIINAINDETVRFVPPLIISKENINAALDIMKKST